MTIADIEIRKENLDLVQFFAGSNAFPSLCMVSMVWSKA